mgnify:CR=1 FL=1
MKLMYFAWLRLRTGIGEEELALPAGVETVSELVDWLKTRGSGYTKAFQELRAIRVAVNQVYVSFDHRLAEGDEVAFFPPVTGG